MAPTHPQPRGFLGSRASSRVPAVLVLLLVAGASATALLGAGASAALPAPANLEPPVISGTAVAGKPLGSTLRFGVELSAMPANAGGARSAPDLRVSHVSL